MGNSVSASTTRFLLILSIWSTAAIAEDSALTEIVVTATKRAEALGKTPLAVSALTQEQLSEQHVEATKDLTHNVPNLSLAANGIGDAIVINLRGIQSSNIFPDGDPAVAVYVDGVNIPRTQGLNGDLYDLARVEVLRGPQGTLYGRNATAGSINIVTAPPTQTLEGHAETSYGNYDDFSLRGIINVPASDTLALRAVATVHRNDGYFDNQNSVRHNYNRADEVFGRVTALWRPTDSLNWQLAISDFNSLGTPNAGIATGPDGRPADGLPVFDRPASSTPQPYDHVNTLSLRSKLNYQVNDQLDLNYTTGYGRVVYANRQVTLGRPLPYTLGATNADIELSDSLNENVSHEIDLSLEEASWRNILGATYFRERNHNIANFTVYNYGIDYDFTIPNTTQRSYGVFDQATINLATSLRFTAGLRFSDDAKDKDGEFISYCPAFTPYNRSYDFNPACFAEIPDAERGEWSKVNWKLGVDGDLNADTLAFASVSTGYKAGGLSDANSPGQLPPPYKPEDVTNWEAGLKTRLLDSALQLNATAFYMAYRNLQVTQVQQPVGQLTVNAASASIYGLELETTWVATTHDRIGAFANILHATYRKFDNAADQLSGTIVPSLAGNYLPLAPRFSARIRYQHDFVLADGAQLSPMLCTYYQSQVYLREFNEPIDRVPAYSKTAASMLFKSPAERWTVEAFVDNLENHSVRAAQFVLAGTYLSYFDPPRTFGLRVGYRF